MEWMSQVVTEVWAGMRSLRKCSTERAKGRFSEMNTHLSGRRNEQLYSYFHINIAACVHHTQKHMINIAACVHHTQKHMIILDKMA